MFLPRAGLIDFLISSQAAKRLGLEFVAHEGLLRRYPEQQGSLTNLVDTTAQN